MPPLSKNPLVSIIVPSFNQGVFINQTIESILDQNYRPIEIWVIDGASTDNTLDVLRRYNNVSEISWISEPDSGVVEAVNKGFKYAQGEIGAIQSSDDFYMPRAIDIGVKELLNNSNLGFVFGDINKIDCEGNELTHYCLKPFSVENVLSLQTWIPQPACFFRMDLAKELGGWREEVSFAADTDLWMRMMLNANAKKINSFLAKRRIHDQQRDIQGDRIISAYERMIKDLFEKYTAPPELRAAADAGTLLLKNRYGYDEAAKVKNQRLRKAVKIYPPLKKHIILPSQIPGVDQMLNVFRKIKSLFQPA